jgi:hypothetical protein
MWEGPQCPNRFSRVFDPAVIFWAPPANNGTNAYLMKIFLRTVYLMRIVLLAILAVSAAAALILDPVFKATPGSTATSNMTRSGFAAARSKAR